MDTRIITGEDNQAMPKSQIQGPVQNFAYDSLNRLRYATTNGVGDGQYQQDYQYDSYTGNLLSRSDVGTFTYAKSKPHAVSSAGINAYIYDSNGNMTHRDTGSAQWEHTYDAENRLVEVEKDGVVVNRYIYEGEWNRVARLGEDNTGTVFIGNYFEAVYPHNTIPDPPPVTEGGEGESDPNAPNPIPQGDITYYYAGSQRIAMRDAWGVHYLLSDHLGSTSVVMDASGQIVETGYYMPWGEQRGDEGIATTDYGYTGQMKEGDIYFYNARWYDPAIGRFMQADTIVPADIQGTQAFDRYAYVNNNPILYRDENGHWVSTLVGGIIGAAVGYGVQVYQNIQSGLTVTDALTTNISAEKILAGAAAGAIAGTFLPLAASAISTTGLFTTGTAAATTMCADGDCTNEIELLRNSGFKTAAEVANSELGQTIARNFTQNSSSSTVSIGSFPD